MYPVVHYNSTPPNMITLMCRLTEMTAEDNNTSNLVDSNTQQKPDSSVTEGVKCQKQPHGMLRIEGGAHL